MPRAKISLSIAVTLMLLVQCGTEDRTANTKLPPTELEEDFQQYRGLIQTHHAGYFTDAAELKRAMDAQFALLHDSLTCLEFYRILAPTVAAIRCGHTEISLPEPASASLHGVGQLPLDVRVINDTLYVYRSFALPPAIPSGSAILSIQATEMSKILDSLKACLPADGHNQTYREFLLSRDFGALYRTFVGAPEQFEVSYLAAGTQVPARVTLPPLTRRRIRQFREAHNLAEPEGPLIETIQSAERDYAILRIRFFGFEDDLESFRVPIDQFFGDIAERKIGSLILDLRGNEGGDPYSSAYLLGYLIGRPFRYFSPASTFLHGELKREQPVPSRPFRGQLYVLIDGGCVSTTGHFCSILKSRGIGTFIGTETGGSYACNGGFKEHVLEHSRIRLLLPYATFIADAPGLPRGRGIFPDVTIAPTIEDLIAARDPAMVYALSLSDTPR